LVLSEEEEWRRPEREKVRVLVGSVWREEKKGAGQVEALGHASRWALLLLFSRRRETEQGWMGWFGWVG
jgi:hypothetical protein